MSSSVDGGSVVKCRPDRLQLPGDLHVSRKALPLGSRTRRQQRRVVAFVCAFDIRVKLISYYSCVAVDTLAEQPVEIEVTSEEKEYPVEKPEGSSVFS